MAEETFEISDLYTKQQEDDGVWYEPEVKKGKPLGIKFKVIGEESAEGSVIINSLMKELDKIKSMDNTIEKAEKEREITAKYISKLVKDMLPTRDGVTLHGQPLRYNQDNVYDIFFNALYICNAVYAFSRGSINFIKEKKTSEITSDASST